MLRRKHIIAAAIILFWVVMTWMLLKREVLIESGTPVAGGKGHYDTWMGIYTPGAWTGL